MQTLFPQESTEARAQLVERYRCHFLELDDTAMPLFPGVAEGLSRLAERGLLLAVATGKSRRGLDRVLDETGTRHLFVASRCADEAFSKPHPQMLEDILEVTGMEPGRALMVGDTVYDMQMAHNARVAGLGVSYGVHARDELLANGALACLDSPAFVVRHAGQAHAYLNRCAHRLVELDWEEGQFFDYEKQHLVCATHGALYDPATGLCIAGPCRGASLVALAVRETEGGVWLAATHHLMVK
jgi:phosphoglycolate phosphatase